MIKKTQLNIFIFYLSFLFVITAVSIYLLQDYKKVHFSNIRTTLETVLITTDQSIRTWANSLMSQTNYVRRLPQNQNILSSLLNIQDKRQDLIRHLSQAQAKKLFNELLNFPSIEGFLY